MSKKRVGIIIGAIVIAAAAAAAIWYFTENGGKDSKDRVYVEKLSAIMGYGTGVLNRYSGVVQPQKTVEINTDSDRTVKDIYVKVGDTVEEGTPLFSYDTDELSMDLEQAKLELENIDSEISNYKNQITELEKEKKEAAEADKFEYTTQIQTVETSIKQSEFEKSSKQLEVDKIQKNIDNSQVDSTASGVIKNLNDNRSQDGGDGSSAFITILSTGAFRIKGSINEQNVSMISPGEDVIVRSRVDESIIWRGTIDSLDTGDVSGASGDDDMGEYEDNMNSSTKYPFYVSLEDTDGLMLGQHVLIELDQGQTEEKEGIWLYSSYIVQEDETAYVWADDGNHRLIRKAVELGEYDEGLDEYEIKSGLTENDMIAWPLDGLYEGIITVTSMDDVDYTSGLYRQEGDTEYWGDSESWDDEYWNDTEYGDDEYWDEETLNENFSDMLDFNMDEDADTDDAGVSE